MNLFNKIRNKLKVREWFGLFKHLSKKKKIMIIVAGVLIIALLCFFIFNGNKNKDASKQTYIEVQAAVGDITETIEQSGVVEPYERYEITSLVKGEIVSSPFEEGDFVNEGDTLYQIDDEDAQFNMEKAQMSLEEANENVSNLNIYAPASGKLTEFLLKVGDNVSGGTIGKINNTEKLAIDIPFSSGDFNKISVGDKVTATSALYMTTLSGTVTHKYNTNSGSGSDGSIVKNIEIEIENPGALADGTTLAATVHTASGDVNSAGSGIIEGGTTSSVRAEVSGEVSYVGAKNGDYVKKGQLIVKLKNNSLVNSQKSSQLSLKSNQKTLDNYNITAPISGTVITKNSKAGDKIDNSNSSTVMMVVADMSKMKFTITVDELDIADIRLGQTAIVDADAIPNATFEAKVTSIASEGVSSGDGVTTFTVELTIDEPGELKSGMNVNANIIVSEASNVVYIPEDALMSINGSSAMVLVKSESGNKTAKKNQKNTKSNQTPTDMDVSAPQSERADGEEMPQGGKPQNESNSEKQKAASEEKRNGANIPDGFELRQVEVGVSDGTYIEIVSGISEGETVAYIPSSSSSDSNGMMGGMMMGGMPSGGGMPTGGGNGGGMPGGGNRGGGMPGGR